MAKDSANKSLVIVESPAKAKTINKYLGKGYTVKASMGHVRDLPPKNLGVKIDEGFKPTYRTIAGREGVLDSLKHAAKTVGKVYFATDLDREGEAIAWHLAEALRIPENKSYRVIFNEITKAAIQKAFKQPGQIDMNKVNAQQARRILDRIVGYMLSPLLWKKITKGLSAGRVQSVAVRLVVEREKEIAAFGVTEYWTIKALLRGSEQEDTFHALLRTFDSVELHVSGDTIKAAKESKEPDKRRIIATGNEAKEIVGQLRKEEFVVLDVTKKEAKSSPPPPFITSTLQQRAASLLGFSTKKTMVVAQQLYEGIDIGEAGPTGLITYMRTDSCQIAEQAIEECRRLIPEQYGDRYLAEKPRRYRPAKEAQAAHEGIRPTSVFRKPDDVKAYLTKDQYRLYDLIWKRTVACQMKEARFLNTTANIAAGKGLFTANGREVLFAGHTILSGLGLGKDDQILPELHEGQSLLLDKLVPEQRFTQPPPRFTEAALVRELEKNGIGRPSTYAPIISTIQERGYVKHEEQKLLRCSRFPECDFSLPVAHPALVASPQPKDVKCRKWKCGKPMIIGVSKSRAFNPTDLGILVTKKLVKHFPDILNVQFTSQMEEDLDKIEEKGADWKKILAEFYEKFNVDLERAKKEMTSEKEEAERTDQKCEKCGKPMAVRWSKRGKFLGCSGYPECDFTLPLAEDGTVAEPEVTDAKCPKCGQPMVVRESRRGKFLGCSKYPECKGTRPIDGGEPKPPPEKTDVKCDKCGSPMVIRIGRRGKFLGCSAFPKCRNTKPLEGEEESREKPAQGAGVAPRKKPQVTDIPCAECGSPMVIRTSQRGKFLGCSKYPKCRHTQSLPESE